MSDSDLSDAPSSTLHPPSDTVLERSLRDEVAEKFRSGDRDQVTVNGIRDLSEKSLGLQDGFYNGHEKWKADSKRIIKDQVTKQDILASSPAKSQTSPVKPQHSHRPEKRSSPVQKQNPRKKQKVISPPEEEEDEVSTPLSELEESEGEAPPQKTVVKSAKERVSKPNPKGNGVNARSTNRSVRKADKSGSRSGLSNDDDTTDPAKDHSTTLKKSAVTAEDSESELSSLIDEGEPSKKRRKSKDSGETQTKATKSRAAGKPDEDPDSAEIKRLQGWLVKCGIRKLWGKELKPYGTPKEKIRHLRDMLSQAGMTGRYSQEKAAQIKEARELAADIEAVQEGAERWGKEDNGEASDEDGAPKRRLVRGTKAYDFLSSDGEETD